MTMNLLITAMALFLLCTASLAQVASEEQRRWAQVPTLTVTGNAQVSAKPDRATVQLGAMIQNEHAGAAQQQVNDIMTRAIEAIRDAGIAEEAITTVGISLHPVFADPRPPRPNEQPGEPRVVGYRASNRIRVQLDDLTKAGEVIDAGVNAGANHVDDISFGLKDETAARSAALREAAKQARGKADAIAEAMNVQIEGVLDVAEGGAQVYPMRMERMGVAAMDAGTPVQPGQVQVHASVTVTYRISAQPGKQ